MIINALAVESVRRSSEGIRAIDPEIFSSADASAPGSPVSSDDGATLAVSAASKHSTKHRSPHEHLHQEAGHGHEETGDGHHPHIPVGDMRKFMSQNRVQLPICESLANTDRNRYQCVLRISAGGKRVWHR